MKRISMKKIKEVLRLKYEQKLSNLKIANSLGVSETTIERCLSRAKIANITWPLESHMDDEHLEKLLYPGDRRKKDTPLPDFKQIYKELKRKGVTLTLLWKEYRDIHKNGYKYTQFCQLYNEWAACSKLWMPQEHKAGESIFVDYAGMTVSIFDSQGKTTYEAQIFVGALGASSYTYAEATKSQQLKDWISSHRRMFQFYDGVPEMLIPDNLKSGVTKANRYEPDLNPTYHEMANYYKTAIVPARSRKPKDKAKVENAVLNIERKLLAPIRNQKFFTLEELNKTLKQRLEKFNKTPFQKLPDISRYTLFKQIEKPELRPLPETPYQFFYWKKAIINPGYHINIDNTHYSVPYKYIKKQVEIRHNERIVEVFYKSNRIAIHPKASEKGKHITQPAHQPISHQKQAECTPENLTKQAKEIGEWTHKWIEKTLSLPIHHINQRKKSCLGVIRLIKIYPPPRLENACKRALYYENFSYSSIKEILQKNLDLEQLPDQTPPPKLTQQHQNIRGEQYFEGGLK